MDVIDKNVSCGSASELELVVVEYGPLPSSGTSGIDAERTRMQINYGEGHIVVNYLPPWGHTFRSPRSWTIHPKPLHLSVEPRTRKGSSTSTLS